MDQIIRSGLMGLVSFQCGNQKETNPGPAFSSRPTGASYVRVRERIERTRT
jgi:hypothetical protein